MVLSFRNVCAIMKIILRLLGCFLLAFRWGAVTRAGPRWLETWFPLLLYLMPLLTKMLWLNVEKLYQNSCKQWPKIVLLNLTQNLTVTKAWKDYWIFFSPFSLSTNALTQSCFYIFFYPNDITFPHHSSLMFTSSRSLS